MAKATKRPVLARTEYFFAASENEMIFFIDVSSFFVVSFEFLVLEFIQIKRSFINAPFLLLQFDPITFIGNFKGTCASCLFLCVSCHAVYVILAQFMVNYRKCICGGKYEFIPMGNLCLLF